MPDDEAREALVATSKAIEHGVENDSANGRDKRHAKERIVNSTDALTMIPFSHQFNDMLSDRALDALRSRTRRRAFASTDNSLQLDARSAETARDRASTAEMQAVFGVLSEIYRGEVERRRARSAGAGNTAFSVQPR